MKDIKNLSEYIIDEALKQGADDVDVIIRESSSSNIEIRLGKIEELKQANPKGLGIRVFKNKRKALTYTSDLRLESVKKLVAQTVEMAGITNQDEFSGLPEKELLGIADVNLSLYDKKLETMSTEDKIRIAKEVEEIGMAQDPLINNSSGAHWSDSKSRTILANSRDFFGEQEYSSCYFSLSLVAEKDGVKQTDYWWTSSRFLNRLDSVENIAKEAARRTVRKIGSIKPKTKKVPVVFDPEVGKDFLNIISYLCDCYSARKLKHPPTGSASRGISSGPSPSTTNFYMQNGNVPPEEIIKSVKEGLYLTSVHWVGVNYVTGDYSRGAEGIWIENGKLTYPVQEFTVASNMLDMMKSIEMIGSDLTFRDSTNAPTFLIKEMMISGS